MHHETLLSSWVYWVICFLFFALANRCDNYKKRALCETISFFIIFLFAVLRYDIGNDYLTYWNAGELGNATRNYELISGAIIDLAFYLRFPPLIFIVFASVSLFGYRRLIRAKSSNPPLSWYMYFTFPLFFLQDCSTVRQAGAMGLFILGYSYIEDKKIWIAILCLILSVFFHTSAAIGFLILFKPLYEKLNVKFSVLLLILCAISGKVIEKVILGYLGNTLLGDKFEYYLQGENPGFNTMQYLLYFIFVANILFFNKLIKDNSRNKVYINLFTIGVAIYGLFTIEPITAIRFSTFFFMFEIMLIPSYKNIIAQFVASKPFANGAIICLMFALQMTLINIYINAYNTGVMERPVYVPYKTWLNHI